MDDLSFALASRAKPKDELKMNGCRQDGHKNSVNGKIAEEAKKETRTNLRRRLHLTECSKTINFRKIGASVFPASLDMDLSNCGFKFGCS